MQKIFFLLVLDKPLYLRGRDLGLQCFQEAGSGWQMLSTLRSDVDSISGFFPKSSVKKDRAIGTSEIQGP